MRRAVSSTILLFAAVAVIVGCATQSESTESEPPAEEQPAESSDAVGSEKTAGGESVAADEEVGEAGEAGEPVGESDGEDGAGADDAGDEGDEHSESTRRSGAVVAGMNQAKTAEVLRKLVDQAGPDQDVVIEMRTTLDYGCPCPTWKPAPLHNRAPRGFPYLMVLPAESLERDPTDHALRRGIYRMRGHFDGREMTGVEWAKARGDDPPNYPSKLDAREAYWDEKSPVFVVEDWCFVEGSASSAYADEIDAMRAKGVPFCEPDAVNPLRDGGE